MLYRVCENVSDEKTTVNTYPKAWCDFSAEEIKINKDLKDHFLNKLKVTVLSDIDLICTSADR